MDADSERSISTEGADDNRALVNAPARTLAQIPLNAMNKLSLAPASPLDFKPSNGLDTPSTDETRRLSGKFDSTMAHSSPKEARGLGPSSPITRQNSMFGNGIARTISSEFGPTKAYSNTNPPPTDEISEGQTTSQWSAAVGKANLGKSGRVIERLMGENDMLKRDLNIERLRAEESNQAAKMIEGKMETLMNEYETRLHDAAINKTLLKRRERQVADFKAQIEMEKQKTTAAIESEKGWREAMEKLEVDSKQKVDEAQLFAAMMEGRNKAMTSHWADQGAEVDKAVAKLGKQVSSIVEERKSDDEKINILRSLCDQQAEQLRALEKRRRASTLHSRPTKPSKKIS